MSKRAGAAGLVEGGAVQLRPGGRSVKVERPGSRKKQTAPGGGERGKITEFSNRSRRNLLQLFGRLRRDARAVFLTLTYHRTQPDPDAAKRHLDNFLKRLRRYAVRGLSAIWKMEPQARGTIHFHLLIYNTRFVPKGRLKAMWHDVTGETSDDHADLGAFVHGTDDPGKLARYVSKYMGKQEGGFPYEYTGRFWGVWQRKSLPVAPARSHRLTIDEARKLQQVMLMRMGVDLDFVPYSLTMNVDDPARWLREALREIRTGEIDGDHTHLYESANAPPG